MKRRYFGTNRVIGGIVGLFVAGSICLFTASSSAQEPPAPTDRQLVEQARALIAPIEGRVDGATRTNLRHILTRMLTLMGQLEPAPVEICADGIDNNGDGQIDEGCIPPPPPDPVDCVLSDWTMTAASAWGACQPDGTQTRTETWVRAIVTEPQNGGAACPSPLPSESRTASQSCTYQPPPPPPTGDHGYFDALSKRSDLLIAASLRDPAQLAVKNSGGYAYCNKCPLDITYDPANDPDPRKQDAAKVVVGTGSNSLRNMVQIPIPAYGSSLFVTWDAWMGKEWATAGIPTYKHWQFASPATRIWTEVRSRFSLAPAGQIAAVDVRYYGTSFGAGTTWGPADSIAPQEAQFIIAPETWTRYFALFTHVGTHVEFSLWMADENRDPVQLLDKRLITPGSSGRWESFWVEFNTSTDAIKAGRPPLVSYVRNVVMLRGINDPTPLLVRPSK